MYGRFIRERGGWISVRHLIDLVEPLGADDASTRTAVSRMRRDGTIRPERQHRSAGYRLTDQGAAFFADGDRRVLERGEPDGRWVLASFSVPESHRRDRNAIRNRLVDLGFGQESAGLLLAPAGLAGEAERALRRDKLDRWVSLWTADFGALGSISEVISAAWDLGELRQRYDDFIVLAETAVSLDVSDERACFVAYVEIVNAWRELAYSDPGLPAQLLGDAWPQPQACRRFAEVEEQLRESADRHFDARAKAAIDAAAAVPTKVVMA